MGSSAKAATTPTPRLRTFNGPAVLSYGFRPFFLLAALWAAIGIAIWLLAFAGIIVLPTSFNPPDWHAHEMLFGFAAAAVAGFVLTAVPNWTGRLPLQGPALLLLTLLWFAGRLAVASSALIGGLTAAAIDVTFLAALFLAVAREITAGRNWRNLPVATALFALLAANAIFHTEALVTGSTPALASRLGIATLVALVALIGGRIIPSFTRNWLSKQGEGRLPAPFGRFDQATLVATVIALTAWVVAADAILTALLLAVAAAANLLRLCRWAADRTLREPLLWMLHVSYLWIPIGLALLALHPFVAAVPSTAGVHALTAGAIGSMVLAVMTRASLGHTGRPLHAGAGTTLIYAAVLLAGGARIGAALFPQHYAPLLIGAGVAWVLAFGLFIALYAKALTTPRPR